jgi:oxygen-independent coproporphyrinogen-3 oxidase
MNKPKAGIYIHVPFCSQKCDYCSFYSIEKKSGLVDTFVFRLCNEIEETLYGRDITADTLYFGGGTPTLLSIDQLESVINSVRKSCNLDSTSEITIEANPDTIQNNRLTELVNTGINRVSLGIQSFDKKALSFIGRCGGYADETLLDLFFSKEISHSVDFITGIHPDFNSIDDLKKIASYRPEHISVYLLSVDENTYLYRRYKPDENFDKFQKESYIEVSDFLTEIGYEHYEISNFAINGKHSQHNSKYWNFTPYFGFGPGAHSYDGRNRFYNKPDLKSYLQKIDIKMKDYRTQKDIKNEFFITALRTSTGGLETDYFTLFSDYFPEKLLHYCKNQPCITVEGDFPNRIIKLTREGWLLSDTIIFNITEFL